MTDTCVKISDHSCEKASQSLVLADEKNIVRNKMKPFSLKQLCMRYGVNQDDGYANHLLLIY
jgi:hypothetical protein